MAGRGDNRIPPEQNDTRSKKFGRLDGCAPTELTTRTNDTTLPPAAVAVDVIFPTSAILLPGAESQEPTWRLIDLFSDDNPQRTWEAELTWTTGTGGQHTCRITVPRATRIALLARYVRIRAFNFYDAINMPNGIKVGVAITDGFDPTRNQWEYRGSPTVGPVFFPDLLFPTFATHVRFELDDPMAWATSYLRFYDESGIPRSTIYANQQPDVGVPVGDMASLAIKADSRFRLLWQLRV